MSSKETFCGYHKRSRVEFGARVTRLGVPEQSQIIDKEDQRSRGCSCLGHPVLGIFAAQKLFDVAGATLQSPTSREDLQDSPTGAGTASALAAQAIPANWARMISADKKQFYA